MTAALEQQLDAQCPNWREINSDPEFAVWLRGVDRSAWRVRRELVDDALARGDDALVVVFFRQFLRERTPPPRTSPPWEQIMQRVYTRDEIKANYERRRRGEYSEDVWNRLEREMLRASKEGRVQGALPVTKNVYDMR